MADFLDQEFVGHRHCQICWAEFDSNKDLLEHHAQYKNEELGLVFQIEQLKQHQHQQGHQNLHQQNAYSYQGNLDFSDHRQCQICFFTFDSSYELRQHLERFWDQERQATRRLEELRRHSYKFTAEGEDDDTQAKDSQPNPPNDTSQSTSVSCPHQDCKRIAPYSTRSNVLRHFQNHVDCFETCRYCSNVFTSVGPFLRHRHNTQKNMMTETFLKIQAARLFSLTRTRLQALEAQQQA